MTLDLSTQLHLLAGLGALVLGTGVLSRAPRRRRNRLFTVLCGALAVWNLGTALVEGGITPRFPWAWVLLGGCAAAPVAIHFAMVVADLRGPARRRLLATSYAAAALLWLAAWWLFPDDGRIWNLAAILVLGVVLLAALGILARHVSRLPAGRERRVQRLVLAAGVVAAAGGLSDFLPRDTAAFPKVGSAFVLLFLLVVSAVVVRQRFLDVDVYLARAVALLAGATVVALLLLAVTRGFGPRFLPLLAASLAILAAAGPVARVLLSGAGLLRAEEPLVGALLAVSRRLPVAREAGDVWRAVEEGRRALPGVVRLGVYLASPDGASFRPAYPDEAGAAVSAGGALPPLLLRDRSPLTRQMLEVEDREERDGRGSPAREALREMAAMDAEMVVPLTSESRLLGWLTVGGGDSESYLRPAVAAALLAVGQQVVASLDRIAAMEEARRREALAAVGELAAGLAHEIRNPVAAIRGAAQAIGPHATPEQAREMLEVIQEESGRLGRFVGEFLEYARPAAPRRERVDLEEVARKVVRGAALAGASLRIAIEAQPGAPAARGDPDQIQRAFENLVRNAAEAAGPAGSLVIHISAAGDRVAARFQDDGPGIAEETLQQLFRPFQTTRPGGTGLGLALVHRIVEAHEGEIRVEGRPGAGAAFTLILPAASRSMEP